MSFRLAEQRHRIAVTEAEATGYVNVSLQSGAVQLGSIEISCWVVRLCFTCPTRQAILWDMDPGDSYERWTRLSADVSLVAA